MRAVKLEDYGKLIVVEDAPKPKPGHEEALIKITASGVCHSDLHIAYGDWIKSMPEALGHEGIGIVEELGEGADKFIKIGDRVILGLGGSAGQYWCGACEFCLSERPMLCSQRVDLKGTFNEYISVWAKALVKIPKELKDTEVPLACAGLTTYSAIKKLSKYVSPGKTIAIVGAAGGLGHYAIQIAKAFGYKVVGIDIGSEKISFIKKMGADHAVDAKEAADYINKNFRGVHASIVLATKIPAFELGLRILRVGGLMVVSGLPALSEGTFPVLPLSLILKGITIITSLVGTVEEMKELVKLAVDGKVKTHVGRTAKLSEIDTVMKELQNAAYLGRAVIDRMDE